MNRRKAGGNGGDQQESGDRESSLQKHSLAQGIQPSYIDDTGKERFVSEETLRALLEKLGADQEEAARSRPGWLEPVVVCWQGDEHSVPLRVPKATRKAPEVFLEAVELGAGAAPEPAQPSIHFQGAGEAQVKLRPLPTGYYNLRCRFANFEDSCLLISAPKKAYAEAGRSWGAFLPLYAAHSRSSWGAGNLSDWKSFGRWLGRLGGQVAGSLPILAAFLDWPVCEPSPYSPASRLFWNEFFVDVTAVPEFQLSESARRMVGSSSFRRKLAAFRNSVFIDYREEWAARRRVLELLAREFFLSDSPRRKEFDQHLRRSPEARQYARFRATCDKLKASWRAWPSPARNGKLSPKDYDEETARFHAYIQWVAQKQIEDALASCHSERVSFYLDLPLGVHSDGYDVWRYPEFFADDVTVGAPPDSYFTKGQDWGFAPLHPHRTRARHYRYVIEFLRFQMRHTGLLRLDHIMGLHRLWWIPRGWPASAGAYVRYPDEELYAILSVESHLHKTMLVGENLGTVPPEVNKAMDGHGIRRMYVLQYEQQGDGAPRDPGRGVVASVNTHDMPTFAAHWKGLDIAERQALGLLNQKQAAAEKRRRALVRRKLVECLRARKLLASGKSAPSVREALRATLKFLAASPAQSVLVNLEDLWGEERWQNVPGTSTERPNWRRKAARTLEQIESDPEIARILKMLAR